jgi:hypothetical protein
VDVYTVSLENDGMEIVVDPNMIIVEQIFEKLNQKIIGAQIRT